MSRRALWCVAAVALLASSCTDGDSGDDQDAGTVAEFCSQLVSAADPFSVEVGNLEAVVDELQGVAAAAPAEIRPAVDTLLGAFETVLAQEDPDDATDLLAARQAELIAAQEELAAYSMANCGIDLSR